MWRHQGGRFEVLDLKKKTKDLLHSFNLCPFNTNDVLVEHYFFFFLLSEALVSVLTVDGTGEPKFLRYGAL